jgi:hypothetical protein
MATPAFSNSASQSIETGKTITAFTVNSGEVLFAFISKGGSDTPTCTWNGGAMTDMLHNNTQGRHQTLFMLSSPTTGSHNAVFSTSQTGGTVSVFTVSGCNATPIGQSSVTANATSTTISDSVTLTYNNSMVVMCSFINNTPTATAGGSQTPIFNTSSASGQLGVASYKIPNTAGAITMTYSLSTSQDWEPITFEIVATTPITPVAATGNFIAFM